MSEGESTVQEYVEVECIQISVGQVINTITSLYGIDARDIEQLDGYDSRNFKITGNDNKSYLLKISNSVDSRRKPFLEMQNKVMLTLLQHDRPVPRPLQSREGRLIEYEEFLTVLDTSGAVGKRIHAVRLFTFLKGFPLASPQTSITKPLVFNIGKTIAQIDRLLSDECWEFVTELPSIEWTFQGISVVKERSSSIEDDKDRALVLYAIEKFEEKILPLMQKLTPAVIHGDPNGWNILVSNSCVSGLVDWEECQKSYAIFELSMLCTYVLAVHSDQRCPDCDAVQLVRCSVDGFCSEWTINDWELQLLPTLILTRLAQELCLTIYTSRAQDPHNDYLLSGVQHSKQLLELYINNPKALEMIYSQSL